MPKKKAIVVHRVRNRAGPSRRSPSPPPPVPLNLIDFDNADLPLDLEVSRVPMHPHVERHLQLASQPVFLPPPSPPKRPARKTVIYRKIKNIYSLLDQLRSFKEQCLSDSSGELPPSSCATVDSTSNIWYNCWACGRDTTDIGRNIFFPCDRCHEITVLCSDCIARYLFSNVASSGKTNACQYQELGCVFSSSVDTENVFQEKVNVAADLINEHQGPQCSQQFRAVSILKLHEDLFCVFKPYLRVRSSDNRSLPLKIVPFVTLSKSTFKASLLDCKEYATCVFYPPPRDPIVDHGCRVQRLRVGGEDFQFEAYYSWGAQNCAVFVRHFRKPSETRRFTFRVRVVLDRPERPAIWAYCGRCPANEALQWIFASGDVLLIERASWQDDTYSLDCSGKKLMCYVEIYEACGSSNAVGRTQEQSAILTGTVVKSEESPVSDLAEEMSKMFHRRLYLEGKAYVNHRKERNQNV